MHNFTFPPILTLSKDLIIRNLHQMFTMTHCRYKCTKFLKFRQIPIIFYFKVFLKQSLTLNKSARVVSNELKFSGQTGQAERNKSLSKSLFQFLRFHSEIAFLEKTPFFRVFGSQPSRVPVLTLFFLTNDASYMVVCSAHRNFNFFIFSRDMVVLR